MKNLILLSLIFFSFTSYSQEITRGPEIGEIYFMGPTTTVLYDAIYHSSDFGESVVCMDSVTCTTTIIGAITADKTSGGLYYNNISDALYYSGNYGIYGTWEQNNSDIGNVLHSGIIEGHIYYAAFKHSEDYGLNFTNHQLNNYYGIYRESEIGYNDKSYLMTYDLDPTDTVYFFISYDSFDNLEIVNTFNVSGYGLYDLSFGFNNGDLFFYNSINKDLYFSNNDGFAWVKKNTFSCPNLPILGITGGRQDGELYMLVEYLQMTGQRRHVYIYHSLDNGESFTVHHPVSIGPNPIYANFIAEDTLVEPGDTVQFIDLSNDAETWEWDFNNDGTIESYEQNPTYIYQDTGYYTVKLIITGVVVEDYGIRNDYIHVDDLTNTNLVESKTEEINIYPNPVTGNFNISIDTNSERIINLCIYNSNGELVRFFDLNNENQQSAISISLADLQDGIHLLKINTPNKSQIKKIIIIH
ncbi:MAG: T9SS type A sorting domain-containing protein [Bacteroidales bacterium]|nr:T9SS type A sorting domain-containing protein [Bacteroidales bacterium]MCF8405068.1 T9SS type A sorting domain-containing protein [Bacteroidales bacterium]